MTRLLTVLMMVAGLSVPAAAQDSTPAPADTPAAGAAPDAAVIGDDEDKGEEEGEGEDAAAATHDATGKFDYGFSGIMARDNRTDLAPLTLASGSPVAGGRYTLKSGGFYRIAINADGSQELALSGGDFFRAIWINEIVINDIEIRPMGVHSIEFDNAGTAVISFVAITPGRYTLSIPGTSGETQQAVFTIQ